MQLAATSAAAPVLRLQLLWARPLHFSNNAQILHNLYCCIRFTVCSLMHVGAFRD